MDDILHFGKQALASQPFSTLLGAELTGFSSGSAELTMPITPELRQQNGFVHGGQETLYAVAQGTIVRLGQAGITVGDFQACPVAYCLQD